MTRGCSRLRSIFWSFERPRTVVENRTLSVVNDFAHPKKDQRVPVNCFSDSLSFESWWQIGSKRLPDYPLRYAHEYAAHLLKCLSLTWDREEPADLGGLTEYYGRPEAKSKFIAAISCEKALGVGFSGMDTKISGDLLTLSLSGIKGKAGYGLAADVPDPVSQLHVVLIAELVIEIRGGIVSVLG